MATLRRSEKSPLVEKSYIPTLADVLAGEYYAPKQKMEAPARKILFDGEFVKKFAREGKGIRGYAIEQDYPENYSCGYGMIFGDPERKVQFYDNIDAIVLTKDDEAVAFASYNRSGEKIQITQIQGTYGKQDELKDLHWGIALICAIEEIAKQGGIKKIIVRSAKNATYSEIKGNSEPGEAGYTIYDVNARRCKYKKNEETGNYEKEI
jgi:hypothetical protein